MFDTAQPLTTAMSLMSLKRVNNGLIVVMRHSAIRAVLDTIGEYLRTTRTIHVVERTEAEEAVEVFSIVNLVAREVLAFGVLKEAVTILHSRPPLPRTPS